MIPYELGEQVLVSVPAGKVAFVNVYTPGTIFGSSGTEAKRFGLSVDLEVMPEGLIADVKVSKLDDRSLVYIRAGVRPEVHVRGFDTPAEEVAWLKDQEEEMRLRNCSHDGMFYRNPLLLVVSRYQFQKSAKYVDDGTNPIVTTLLLDKLTVIAREDK